MTNEEINKAIAEKVMGYTDVYFNENYRVNDIMAMYARTDYSGDLRASVGSFSTDISSAWLVVEKMVNEGHAPNLINNDDGEWQLCFCSTQECTNRPEYVTSFCDDDLWYESAPLAICLAALKAIS